MGPVPAMEKGESEEMIDYISVIALITVLPPALWFGYKILHMDDDDPVYHCPVFKKHGCSHVDGMLCDMKTCPILRAYRIEKECL